MKSFHKTVLLLSLGVSFLQSQERTMRDVPHINPILNITQTEPLPLLVGANSERKSVFAAVAMSLILPGTGEWYVGNVSAARIHLFAEGGIWISYTVFRLRSTWLRNDAHTFARTHAGATFEGTDEDYDVNIGNYMSVNDYNEAKLRSREYDLVYTEPRYAWQWDTDANRQAFKSNRIKSSEAKNNAKFVVAFAVVNRLISAFRAGRMASAYNASIAEHLQFDLQQISDVRGTPAVKLSISTSF